MNVTTSNSTTRRTALVVVLFALGAQASVARAGPDSAAVSHARVSDGSHGALATILGTIRRGDAAVATRVELRRLASTGIGVEGAVELSSWMLQRLPALPDAATPPLAAVTTVASGRFSFDGLDAGVYEVRGGPTGGEVVCVAFVPDGHSQVLADVALPAGSLRLVGRAAQADGTAMPGTVWILRLRRTSTPLAIAELTMPHAVGADGNFSFDGVEPGLVSLQWFSSDRSVIVTRLVSVPSPSPIRIGFDGPLEEHRGLVMDDAGAPVAGATVRALTIDLESMANTSWSSATGPKGEYALRLPAKTTEIEASARGLAEAHEYVGGGSERLDQFEPGPRWTREGLRFELSRGGVIEGRVLADDGPKAAVEIAIARSPRGYGPDPFARVCRLSSGPDGRFRVEGLPPADYLVAAIGGGYGSRRQAEDRRDPNPSSDFGPVRVEDGKTSVFDVHVIATGFVTGHVVDAAKAPVAWAQVVAKPESRDEFRRGAAIRGAVTDERGAYRLDDVPADMSLRIEATRFGEATTISGPVAVAAGGTMAVDLAFTTPRALDVLVRDAGTHEPIGGARVYVDGGPRAGGVAPPPDATGPDGRVRFASVPQGPLRVSARAPLFRHAEAMAGAVGTKAGPLSITIEMPAANVVSARAVIPDGAPVAAVEWSVKVPRGEAALQAMTSMFMGARGASIEGDHATFGIEKPGTYSVEARLCWKGTIFQAAADVATSAPEATLTLAPLDLANEAGATLVHVLDPDGHIVPRAHLRLARRSARGEWSDATEIGDNRHLVGGVALLHAGTDFELPDPAHPATLELHVWRAQDDHLVPLPFGAAIAVAPVGGGVLEVRLPKERQVTVSATTADGRPVRGLRVGVRFPSEKRFQRESVWVGESVALGRTDAKGSLTLGGIGPGPWALEFLVPEEYARIADRTLCENESSVSLVLRPSTPVTIRVVAPDGKPVPHAVVRVANPPAKADGKRLKNENGSWPRERDAKLTIWYIKTDERGEVRLPGLEARERLTLIADPPENERFPSMRDFNGQPPSDGSAPQPLEPTLVVGWAPHDTTIALRDPEKTGVSGVAVGADGKPAAGVRIWRAETVNTYDWKPVAVADPDGRFFVPVHVDEEVVLVAADEARAKPSTEAEMARWGTAAVRGREGGDIRVTALAALQPRKEPGSK
jgi:hypothetical protein